MSNKDQIVRSSEEITAIREYQTIFFMIEQTMECSDITIREALRMHRVKGHPHLFTWERLNRWMSEKPSYQEFLKERTDYQNEQIKKAKDNMMAMKLEEDISTLSDEGLKLYQQIIEKKIKERENEKR